MQKNKNREWPENPIGKPDQKFYSFAFANKHKQSQ
jgi:hypothetical protein